MFCVRVLANGASCAGHLIFLGTADKNYTSARHANNHIIPSHTHTQQNTERRDLWSQLNVMHIAHVLWPKRRFKLKSVPPFSVMESMPCWASTQMVIRERRSRIYNNMRTRTFLIPALPARVWRTHWLIRANLIFTNGAENLDNVNKFVINSRWK